MIYELNEEIEFNKFVQPICLTKNDSIFDIQLMTAMVVGWPQEIATKKCTIIYNK